MLKGLRYSVITNEERREAQIERDKKLEERKPLNKEIRNLQTAKNL